MSTVLRELGARHGIAAETVAPVLLDGERGLVEPHPRGAAGRRSASTATRLLTRPFAIEGVVEHGDKRGRELGYPTANLDARQLSAPALRHLCGARAARRRPRASTASPTSASARRFDPPEELLEPYFFDFDGDLYGRRSRSRCITILRPEAKFDELDALKAQMDEDAAEARAAASSSPSVEAADAQRCGERLRLDSPSHQLRRPPPVPA